jgi:glycerol-3-phosphate dehydrogenase subunit B
VRGELHYDAVVIGAGTAGLVAGARLAEGGARVCVVAKGYGSTHLAPATIDVLGYAPERVVSPSGAMPDFVSSHPDHPYAALGIDAVAEAVRWFQARVESGPAHPLPGYRYFGDVDRNYLLPTAVGALRPSAIVPETMAAGDSVAPERVCVVGTRALRDFHAALCASNLSRLGIPARWVEIEIEVDKADQNTLGLARRFDDPTWRAAFAARLALKLQADERVGLPAMLGLRDPSGVWSDLQHRLGRPVFEISGLPPSVPGMRLYEILRSTLRGAGGRLVLGAEVVSCERDGSRVTSVATRSAGHDAYYAAPWFVLAAGGFNSGAIELDSRWATHDRVLGLPLRGLPAPGEPRFVGDYLAEQPMSRAGVAVDGELRADGAENVVVAGAALPGAVPWREGSGEGIALASGSHAAQLILARSGAPAGAAA